MSIVTLKISDIAITDRVRALDDEQVAVIAKSIGEKGQLQPILVRPTPNAEGGLKPKTLVFGGHRLAALELLGRDTVDAIVRDLSPDEAKLIEIDENLHRADLTVLDRAISHAERKKVYPKAQACRRRMRFWIKSKRSTTEQLNNIRSRLRVRCRSLPSVQAFASLLTRRQPPRLRHRHRC
jgi:ParB family chromosome partitioning protein